MYNKLGRAVLAYVDGGCLLLCANLKVYIELGKNG